MIIDKKFTIKGIQAYTITAGDIIVVRIKGSEEFKYKIPDNWAGSISVSIDGILSEIIPTPTNG